MDGFLENTQRIFEVARSGADGGNQDFALLIRPDGGLHFVMESPFSIEAAAIHAGARRAWRITRSREMVRAEGQSVDRNCMLRERSPRMELIRDQSLYRITSPLLTPTGS
jgi:hypothetical protein